MSNENVLGFGKKTDSTAGPIRIGGAENNKLMVMSLDSVVMFENILRELKKFNTQLETITATKLTKEDVYSQRKKL